MMERSLFKLSANVSGINDGRIRPACFGCCLCVVGGSFHKLNMKNGEKLVRQLFVGKVSEILGLDKTLELLKEANEVFPKCEHNEDKDPKAYANG